MLGIFKKKQQPLPVVSNNDKPTVQIIGNDDIKVDTVMSTHIGTRKYQQDAAYVTEPLQEQGVVFGILCDGMGGMDDGELVSADVVEYFANALSQITANDNISESYYSIIQNANLMIHDRYVSNGRDAGTTLVSVFIFEDSLYWASVGDSRIYLIRNGEIVRLTKDHNYALKLQELVDMGKLTQEEADNDPKKDALVSYLGAPVLEVIDVSKSAFKLEQDDMILLCSDGLTKLLNDEEILAKLTPIPNNLGEAVHRMIVSTIDRNMGGQDNTSVILIRYYSK